MARTLTAPELEQKLARGERPVLLDVRRKADRDADPQTIPGAHWQDPEKMQTWSADLPSDKEIVIYCARGGSVSNSVLDHLLGKNLKARFVEGGLAAWKEAVKK